VPRSWISSEEGQEYPGIKPFYFVLGEKSEGIGDWFEHLKLPTTVGNGYGPLIWLENGRWVQLVPNAADKGIDELLGLTADLWGSLSFL
jgi:hypothetical protein